MGEVAIPKMVAQQLTIPETVNKHNIDTIQKIINTGKGNFLIRKGTKNRINLKYALNQRSTELFGGDEVIRNGEKIIVDDNSGFVLKNGDQLFRNGEKINNLKFPGKKIIKLNMGDVVERQLQSGDFVLLNRQPLCSTKLY